MNEKLLRPYLKTITLLCVENSEIINIIYEGLFTILFKEVIFAKTVEDAITIYEQDTIDIVITAQDFEAKSGMDLIKLVRKNDKEIPIIFVSSFEHKELLTEAIDQKVTSFLKKPFETTDILDAIESATKQLLAKKFIEEKRKEELNTLKDRVSYADYQENLSFQKALKVIRNDYYYKQLNETKDSFEIIDFLYNAKDVISGDSYSSRKIDNDKTLVFIVDGMGKGHSASLTALIMVSSLNRCIDVGLQNDKIFSLKDLISNAISHIQKILLEEEVVSMTCMLVDTKKERFKYASFSMPPILIENKKDEVLAIKSNNPPISCYTQDFQTKEISSKDIVKILLYSDGLVENSLKNKDETYAEYIKEDFKDSISREDFRKKVVSRIDKQEDDITFILFHKIPLTTLIESTVIETKLDFVEKTNEWFETIIKKQTNDKTIQNNASLAFMELLMNAYEHGNLHIEAKEKHHLIEDGEYFDLLAQKELTCDKKIYIDIFKHKNSILVKIKDEGSGFDTSLLSGVFGIHKRFNQRGILMSRNASSGIYYNDRANQITFIIKLYH